MSAIDKDVMYEACMELAEELSQEMASGLDTIHGKLDELNNLVCDLNRSAECFKVLVALMHDKHALLADVDDSHVEAVKEIIGTGIDNTVSESHAQAGETI